MWVVNCLRKPVGLLPKIQLSHEFVSAMVVPLKAIPIPNANMSVA